MLTIPMKVSESEYVVFIALQDSNIERIKRYDPAEIVPAKFGGDWHTLKLREIHISYATAEDEVEITRLCKQGKAIQALKLLTRGFSFKPDMGDHDGQYGSALKPH